MRNFYLIALAFLAGLYLVFFTVPVNLLTSDLGRHIKNGAVLLQDSRVITQNLYSYTFPDFPFVNHHWLSGVILYLVFLSFGFVGLSVFFTLVSFATLGIFLYLAIRQSSILMTIFSGLIFFPLIINRTEIRPELFSNLFLGVYYLVLWNYTKGIWKLKSLWTLPIIGLIWINLHIYFFLGLIVIGIFIIDQLVEWLFFNNKASRLRLVWLGIIGFGTSISWLLNPAFFEGVIHPLRIYGNYGYRVLEEQSILFLKGIISLPSITYYKFGLLVLALSWGWAIFKWWKYKERVSIANLLLSLFFAGIAFNAIRNFTIFGFFALTITAINFGGKKSLELFQKINIYALITALIVVLLVVFSLNQDYWVSKKMGFGLVEGSSAAAEFFIQNKLSGPIFNNYDIGGYLIYYLYPGERVFVDNRPEVYPKNFLQEVYVRMQEDESVWMEQSERWGFNTIFFYRHDLTNWGQKFLVTRVKDPDWAAVYVDDYAIIFVKRNEKNSEIIEKFELPKGIFKVS